MLRKIFLMPELNTNLMTLFERCKFKGGFLKTRYKFLEQEKSPFTLLIYFFRKAFSFFNMVL